MKKSAVTSAAAFLVAAALVLGLASPASASTWNATVVPPSSIAFAGGAPFPLGVAPPTPPASCGIPTWTPPVVALTFDSDAAPTSLSASFDLPALAMVISVLGGPTMPKRVQITNVAIAGTVNPTTGAISGVTGTAKITFKACSAGLPTECVLNATIGTPVAGTGTVSPAPPITSASTATLSMDGKLATTTGCGFTYVLGLNGKALNLSLDLDLL